MAIESTNYKYISYEILLDGHISENDIRICIFFALQK